MDDQITQGVDKTIDLFNKTVVSHTEDGFTVILDAKPEILSIAYGQENPDLSKLSTVINNAITKVKTKLIQEINQTIK